MRIVHADRRVMIVDGDIVLSEVLLEPGATNGLFDVLSASIHALSPGPRVAVLGFGAGGVVPPLRAMGGEHEIEGVDLSTKGEPIFRKHCSSWAGAVKTTHAEAYDWLGRKRKPYDFILEDLSESHPENGAVKPWISLDVLPARMSEKLATRGVVAVNLLPWPGASWRTLLDRVAAPFRSAIVIHFDEYDNRLLIAGNDLGAARDVGRHLRSSLDSIGSNQSSEIVLRSWK